MHDDATAPRLAATLVEAVTVQPVGKVGGINDILDKHVFANVETLLTGSRFAKEKFIFIQ